MPKTPYADGAPAVNPEIIRQQSLISLDLITTKELLVALRCSRRTLAKLREHGLEQLGEGKDVFYRRSAVAAALERQARLNPNHGTEAEDDGE